MKVLMLTPYLPFPLVSGGQIRTYNLLKQLSKTHDITLFSLIKDEKEKEFLKDLAPYCKKIKLFKRTRSPWSLRNILLALLTPYPFLVTRNWPLSMKKAVKKELTAQDYDLIHAETFYMMPNIPATDTPIILVEQTIEYLGYQEYTRKANPLLRPLLAIDVEKIKYWETLYWKKADRLITMSDEDRVFIQKELNDPTHNISVVANGVDLEYFKKTKKNLPRNPTVLFVGTFKWLPNIEAVDVIVNEIWPAVLKSIPAAKLKIVGFSPTSRIKSYSRLPSIEVLGGIPDIRDAFASSHMLLAPILSGKGTRFKVLEAMVTGTPVVATSLAVEGIAVTPNENVLTADDSASLAELTIKVLTDQNLQQKLARNGMKIVVKNYSWDAIAKDLDRIYKEFN